VVNCTFKVEGMITDFNRVDDAFKAIKAQAVKMLKDWKISVSIEYEESQGTGEIPK